MISRRLIAIVHKNSGLNTLRSNCKSIYVRALPILFNYCHDVEAKVLTVTIFVLNAAEKAESYVGEEMKNCACIKWNRLAQDEANCRPLRRATAAVHI